MSENCGYLVEKKQIDSNVNEGFIIKYINEHIDGDTVTWIKVYEEKTFVREMLLKTADARKHLGVVLINQMMFGGMRG